MQILKKVVVLLFIFTYTYSQEDITVSQEITLKPLQNTTSILAQTFKPYKPSRKISSDIAIWRDRYQKAQSPYKVSLVGVNINTWLENPGYFTTLKKLASDFPVTTLLENLQSYNPTLEFNDPTVVAKALHTDIYTPYLNNVTDASPISLQFSDITNIISYTRRYHIYGAAAGNLPYFGRPMEGGRREINLGLLQGQLSEVIVKLPETDIFLVATVNVVPNWLEEGLNIFHYSQQQLEILVYAFDRRGKLIGGAGVPMDFVYRGDYVVMDQKITSKIIQPGVSRQFYILPSYRILNTYDHNAVAQAPNITIPEDDRPVLNKAQRYILSAITHLRTEKKPLNVELFNQDGSYTIKKRNKAPKSKVVLANRILLHKESDLLVERDVSDLFYLDLLVRLEDKKLKAEEKKQKEEDKRLKAEEKKLKKEEDKRLKAEEKKLKKGETISTKKLPPSNEGLKLESLLAYGKEMLIKAPITHSNKLHYTNIVLPYEVEQDPVDYAKERKKYTFVNNNTKEYRKKFNKDTKLLLKNQNVTNKDRKFWYDFLQQSLDQQDLLSPDLKNLFKQWASLSKKVNGAQKSAEKFERGMIFYKEIEEQFPFLKRRHHDYLKQKYYDKPKKLAKSEEKLELYSQKILARFPIDKEKLELAEQKKKTVSNYQILQDQKYDLEEQILGMVPSDINYFKVLEDGALDVSKVVSERKEEIQLYSKLYNIPGELVVLALVQEKISPLQKQKSKEEKKQLKKEKKLSRHLSYEGYMLGLTRAWTTKTKLQDRLDHF